MSSSREAVTNLEEILKRRCEFCEKNDVQSPCERCQMAQKESIRRKFERLIEQSDEYLSAYAGVSAVLDAIGYEPRSTGPASAEYLGPKEIAIRLVQERNSLRAENSRLIAERDAAQEKISELSSRIGAAHRLQQLTQDNQVHWMEKATAAEQRAEAAETERDTLQNRLTATLSHFDNAFGVQMHSMLGLVERDHDYKMENRALRAENERLIAERDVAQHSVLFFKGREDEVFTALEKYGERDGETQNSEWRGMVTPMALVHSLGRKFLAAEQRAEAALDGIAGMPRRVIEVHDDLTSKLSAAEDREKKLREALENLTLAAGSYRSDLLHITDKRDREWAPPDEFRDRHLREARAALEPPKDVTEAGQ